MHRYQIFIILPFIQNINEMKTIAKIIILVLTINIINVVSNNASAYAQDEKTALDYKELQKYLPDEIDGYTAGEPDGGSMTMNGVSFSTAAIEFTNDDGGTVDIAIMDYTTAASAYQMSTAMWASGFSIENDEISAHSIDWGDEIAGWEQIDKEDNVATIMLGINSRFLITVSVSDQNDTDLAKEIMKIIDIDSLNSL